MDRFNAQPNRHEKVQAHMQGAACSCGKSHEFSPRTTGVLCTVDEMQMPGGTLQTVLRDFLKQVVRSSKPRNQRNGWNWWRSLT